MLNIEKYRDEILRVAKNNSTIAYNIEEERITCCPNTSCENCLFKKYKGKCDKARYEWLLSEYKEPILDEVEREYLSDVCRPYEVKNITKYLTPGGYYHYIRIKTVSASIYLPNFKKTAMYKGMELGKNYTPQELGITCKNNRGNHD